jgi:hypothetical protein
VDNKLYSFPAVRVYDAANVLREVYFEENPDSYTGVDSVDILVAGENYTSVPTVTIVGDGIGATAVATISGGRVTNISITNNIITITITNRSYFC